jgi:hypothetical protein
MNPQVRTGLTHAATAVGSAVAVSTFLATKSVDLYAIVDQVGTVVADITKLVASITAIAGPAYGIWKATSKSKVADIAADPRTQVQGNTIVLKDTALVQAAQAAATPNTVGDLRGQR